jgi:hypothetical protein
MYIYILVKPGNLRSYGPREQSGTSALHWRVGFAVYFLRLHKQIEQRLMIDCGDFLLCQSVLMVGNDKSVPRAQTPVSSYRKWRARPWTRKECLGLIDEKGP